LADSDQDICQPSSGAFYLRFFTIEPCFTS